MYIFIHIHVYRKNIYIYIHYTIYNIYYTHCIIYISDNITWHYISITTNHPLSATNTSSKHFWGPNCWPQPCLGTPSPLTDAHRRIATPGLRTAAPLRQRTTWPSGQFMGDMLGNFGKYWEWNTYELWELIWHHMNIMNQHDINDKINNWGLVGHNNNDKP